MSTVNAAGNYTKPTILVIPTIKLANITYSFWLNIKDFYFNNSHLQVCNPPITMAYSNLIGISNSLVTFDMYTQYRRLYDHLDPWRMTFVKQDC